MLETGPDLALHQEILLLALREEEGTFLTSSLDLSLGAALLVELALREAIEVGETAEGRVAAIAGGPEPAAKEEPLLAETLEQVRSSPPRTTRDWVRRLSGIGRLEHRVADELCHLGVLNVDEEKILLVFSRKIYPEINPLPERALRRRLHQAIFGTDEVAERTAVLIALLGPAGLLRALYDAKEVARRKARIEAVVHGEKLGQVAARACRAAEDALTLLVRGTD